MPGTSHHADCPSRRPRPEREAARDLSNRRTDVSERHSTLERMTRCGRVVWHRDGYGVIAVGKMPGNLS